MSNQLRIVYLNSVSSISYCGFVINAGTRDEQSNQFGLAHFVEHMLFKGSKKRKAKYIINCMGNIGGEINAFTTKEETFLYSICLSDDTERVIKLLSNLIFHPLFPSIEIEKEKKIIIDEINLCNDNPSELIFDEFENLLFQKSELGHSILGKACNIHTFTSQSCFEFTNIFYRPENMVFFFYGEMPFVKILHLSKKYFIEKKNIFTCVSNRITPKIIHSQKKYTEKKLHQSHIIIGSRGYNRYNEKRIGLYLLSNLLGGAGIINSRLNVTLREKYGLVYLIESNFVSYSDTGNFNIYFCCDPQSRNKCISLIYKELKKLCTKKLNTLQLHVSTKQLKGKLGIANENKENFALAFGKNLLHSNKYNTLSEIYKKIDILTPSDILEIANEIFDEKNIFQLIFE